MIGTGRPHDALAQEALAPSPDAQALGADSLVAATPFSSEVPTPDELGQLVAYAEPVAEDPHAVRLESFRGDTISGVFLVDSDAPTARHVAFGKDASGSRYVWFSRRNPLRASVVAMYQVDGRGLPDVLYWRQIDFGAQAARAREFRAPSAGTKLFDYSSGPPCGRPPCEGWVELPLERIGVPGSFFEPLRRLFHSAAEHGEPWLDRLVGELQKPAASGAAAPPVQAVATRSGRT